VSDELERVLAQLAREYVAQAPSRLDELRKAVAAFRAGEPGAINSLSILFHRLAGSGGSYGFPAVSEIGRSTERWLKSDPPPRPDQASRLDEAVAQLARCFDEAAAKQAENGETQPPS
jgi:HPt (histidine-containing phosphotransfer) domain-containing protein